MISLMFKDRKSIEKEFENLQKELPNEEIRIYNSYDELKKDIKDVEIILNPYKVDYNILEDASNLKWIMSYSAGVDTYDADFFRRKDIVLTNASGVHTKQISEQIIGALIYFSRDFIGANKAKKEHKWIQKTMEFDELYDKNLLIVGAGQIGREIAHKANVFEMNVYGIRFSNKKEEIENFIDVWNVKEMNQHLKDMDYVVLVLPSTKETFKMFKREQFDLMKETAVFMNIGRGDTVDEDALIEALENKKIKGAYLDVFMEEPLKEDSKIWDMDNILITPHVGGLSPYYAKRAFKLFKENIIRFRNKEKLKNIINLDRMY